MHPPAWSRQSPSRRPSTSRICVDALERRANRLYEWNFVRNLKSRMRRKAQHFPALFDVDALAAVRTVRQFDDVYTAPHFGFGDAATTTIGRAPAGSSIAFACRR